MSKPANNPKGSTTTTDHPPEDAVLCPINKSCNDCTEADREAFKKSERQAAQHFTTAEAVPSNLSDLRDLNHIRSKTLSQLQNLIYNVFNTWFLTTLLLLIGISVTIMIMSFPITPLHFWLAEHHNEYNLWSTQIFSDQSEIKMSGKTAYDADFGQAQRSVKLYQGNILVQASHHAHYPCIVETRYVKTSTDGARFIVQHYKDATLLTVLEAQVTIAFPSAEAEIFAGQQVMINHQGMISKTQISPRLVEAAWNKQQLIAFDMPLGQVMGLLQNYQNKTLVYNVENLEHFRVNGTLPLNASALDLLEKNFPIKIKNNRLNRVKIKPHRLIQKPVIL